MMEHWPLQTHQKLWGHAATILALTKLTFSVAIWCRFSHQVFSGQNSQDFSWRPTNTEQYWQDKFQYVDLMPLWKSRHFVDSHNYLGWKVLWRPAHSNSAQSRGTFTARSCCSGTIHLSFESLQGWRDFSTTLGNLFHCSNTLHHEMFTAPA